MSDIIYEMTDDVAFRLGKFDFPHFYQFARWKINQEPFPLLEFFKWGLSCGVPVSSTDHSVLWDGFNLEGSLKLELIKTIPQKLAYIRGRLESYSVGITETSIEVYYANSHNFRDFFAQCLEDVILDKYSYSKENCKLRFLDLKDLPKYEITKGETVGTYPATPHVSLKADKEIIDYIIGKT